MVLVEKGLFVGAVVEEKTFVVIAGAEVAPQKGQNLVFWLDFAAQDAA